MDERFAISSLLQELEAKEVSLFYAFNELKNILLDQNHHSEQESLFLFALKKIDPHYHKELFMALALSSDILLNRMVIYELKELVSQLSDKDHSTMMRQILSLHYKFPLDTKEALKEQGFIFHLESDALLTLLQESQWQKILLFENEIQKMHDNNLTKNKVALIQAASELDAKLTQEIHGEHIKLIEDRSILKTLQRNLALQD